MSDRIGFYDSTYGLFADPVRAAVRHASYGVDIGQNSWVTVEEYARFVPWLELTEQSHVLEVATGSGGPALYLARQTGCRVTGIDSNEHGVATAAQMAIRAGLETRVEFRVADASARLPFGDDAFDAIVCMDAMNHLPNRLDVLREWRRVLHPGRRAVFTDPVVVTGAVTYDELAQRSSIGHFLFVPPGENERFASQAGFRVVRQEDVTDNTALVSRRWRAARRTLRDELVRLEGEEGFENQQRFLDAVHRLSSERRLSRILYLVERPPA